MHVLCSFLGVYCCTTKTTIIGSGSQSVRWRDGSVREAREQGGEVNFLY